MSSRTIVRDLYISKAALRVYRFLFRATHVARLLYRNDTELKFQIFLYPNQNCCLLVNIIRQLIVD